MRATRNPKQEEPLKPKPKSKPEPKPKSKPKSKPKPKPKPEPEPEPEHVSKLLERKDEPANEQKEQTHREQSIKLPTNYRKACKYVQMAVEEKCDIDPLLAQDRHFRAGRTVVGRVLSNYARIDAIYAKLELATKEPELRPWVARVLISELMYGSGNLIGNSIPVECMRKYAEEIRTLVAEMQKTVAGSAAEPRFVRINTNQLSVEDAKRLLAEENWQLVEDKFADYRAFLERVKKLAGMNYMEDFHFPDMLVFPSTAKTFWARARHLKEKFTLQNKACLLPTYLLRPAKKSVVLDMCAAPGLKTTHLAALMQNKGRIYAVERDAMRFITLCQQVGSNGIIKTIHSDCLNVADEQVPDVEYILLDPSCSGSGMLQRRYRKEEVDEHRLFKLGGLQHKLLSHAMNAFPNVRRIVYSTCSLYVQENEEVVQGVLRRNAHFRLLDARKELGKEWLNVGSPNYPGIGERCLYARTETDLTIGMFVAVFERCPEGVQNEVYLASWKQHNSNGPHVGVQQDGPIVDVLNDEEWRPEAPFALKRKAVPETEQPKAETMEDESPSKKLKRKPKPETVEKPLLVKTLKTSVLLPLKKKVKTVKTAKTVKKVKKIM